jgi:glycosyltransferase involved in cell wall biosynthesis
MIVAVIPAYNEEKTIGPILEKARSFADKIIIVDDGSTDKTAEIAKQYGVGVLSHVINRGLGAALRTGFAAALKENAEMVVTLDADGQHNPEDIPKLIEPIKNGSADAVIGSRFLKNEKAPLFRKIANWVGNAVTYLFFGIWVTDSQSGFRAFSRKALLKIHLKSSGMEVSSEIIKEIKRNNLRLAEVPIKPVYTKYSMSKGQNLLEGVKTVFQLILRRLE